MKVYVVIPTDGRVSAHLNMDKALGRVTAMMQGRVLLYSRHHLGVDFTQGAAMQLLENGEGLVAYSAQTEGVSVQPVEIEA